MLENIVDLPPLNYELGKNFLANISAASYYSAIFFMGANK
jgi:hypothetical protein